MRLLLDTHVLLWAHAQRSRIPPSVWELLDDLSNELLLSAASSWEIAVKYAAGRLPLPQPPARYVPERMRNSGIVGLPVDHAHALEVAVLPHHHRDPFDRLLVAQARVEGLPLLTADRRLEPYDVELVWAK